MEVFGMRLWADIWCRDMVRVDGGVRFNFVSEDMFLLIVFLFVL